MLLFSGAVFSFSLFNGFINWDDTEYITENPLIRNLSLEGLGNIFSQLHYNGFLPVMELSLAIDYFFWDANPLGFHLTSVMLHLANVSLVYFFSYQLTLKKNVSLITALLFAIHPMHVESVAWAAERKDVLFSFFYLLSLIFYVKYLKSNFKFHFIILCFLFYGLSLFSKWSALPLPAVLLLLDYYFQRKSWKIALFEKLFFLAIPALSIYLHFSKGTIIAEQFPFFFRIFLGVHSLLFYLIKFIAPFNLSAVYPYPELKNGFLPAEYYFSLPLLIAMAMPAFVFIKKLKGERRFVFFCIGFFILNLGMVLHFLSPIGGVVVAADRYTYIPYCGLLLLVGFYVEKQFEKSSRKKFLVFLFTGILLSLSFYSISRSKTWKNSIVFFKDVLSKDSTIAFAWNNLGIAEADEGRQREAIACYSNAIKIRPDFSFAINNRALAYDATGQYDKAISDYNYAINLKRSDPMLFFNRALTHYHSGGLENAIKDLSEAIEINPAESKYYIKRGAVLNDIGNYSLALKDFLNALKISPQNAEVFNYIGVTYNYLNRLDDALWAYNSAIGIDPEYSSALNNRGWVLFLKKDNEGAMRDLSKSIELDPSYSFPYHNRGLLYYENNMPEKACTDWKAALKLGYENSKTLIEKYCK